LTIFCTYIPDTAGHQMVLQVPTSPNICFYTTWGKHKTELTRYYILYKAALLLY